MPIDIPGWVERQPNLGNMYLEQAMRMRQMASQAPIEQMNALKVQEAQRQQAAEADYRLRLSGLDYSDPNKINVAPMINAAAQSGNTGQIGPLSQLAAALKPPAAEIPPFVHLQNQRDAVRQQLDALPETDARRPLYEGRVKELDAKIAKESEFTPRAAEPPVIVPDPRSKTGYRYVQRDESYGKEAPAPASMAEKPLKMSPTEIKDALQGAQAAKTARESVSAIDKALTLVDKGIYTGSFATLQTAGAKLSGKIGFTDRKKAERTETFTAHLGSVVLPMMQLLGGSDTVEELRYMKSVVAGDVNLEEKTIRSVLASFKEKMNQRVAGHNAFVKSAEETYQHVPPGIRLTATEKTVKVDGVDYEVVEDLGKGKLKIRDPKTGRTGMYQP